jgi:hypothetical protein
MTYAYGAVAGTDKATIIKLRQRIAYLETALTDVRPHPPETVPHPVPATPRSAPLEPHRLDQRGGPKVHPRRMAGSPPRQP